MDFLDFFRQLCPTNIMLGKHKKNQPNYCTIKKKVYIKQSYPDILEMSPSSDIRVIRVGKTR